MKQWAGLSQYDDITKEKLAASPFDGYVIGDLFCSKKMFAYGEAGLYRFADVLQAVNKEMMYQSKMYLTDRVFSDEMCKIRFLHEKCGVNKVLVQDIGLALSIREAFPSAEVIWSRMGRNRNSIMNHSMLDFLLSMGVRAIETDDTLKASLVANYMNVYAVYGAVRYHTLSRDCYCRYLLNHFDGSCERECLKKKMTLSHEGFSMTVNGHMLGERLVYNESDEYFSVMSRYAENIIVYAENETDAEKRAVGETT